jgi:hypothetical protein
VHEVAIGAEFVRLQVVALASVITARAIGATVTPNLALLRSSGMTPTRAPHTITCGWNSKAGFIARLFCAESTYNAPQRLSAYLTGAPCPNRRKSGRFRLKAPYVSRGCDRLQPNAEHRELSVSGLVERQSARAAVKLNLPLSPRADSRWRKYLPV